MKLSEVANFSQEKISINKILLENYISTENMLQNKEGICISSSIPTISKVTSFKKNDILISNIRPYFKKIWLAQFSGGCSNDILVIRAKNNYNYKFLYYVLSSDNFFNYATATSKGTKMPRGDKEAIMNYSVPDFKIDIQKKIGDFLYNLDKKILINKEINDNLEQQAFALFKQLLLNTDKNKKISVSDIAYLNPKRNLSKKQEAKYIEMSNLSTTSAFPSGWDMKPFNGGMRFANGDTLLARITPCLENGKAAFINFLDSSEVAFGSTEYIVLASKGEVPPEFLYCLVRYPLFYDYAIKNMNGSSGRQRVSSEIIGSFELPHPSLNDLNRFRIYVSPLFLKMKSNFFENIYLSSIRNTLLPKLISGGIDISKVNI